MSLDIGKNSEVQKSTEEQFRLLVESVKDYAIFMLDPEGFIVTWNKGAERIKGYKAEEIIGKHFSTFYTQEDRESHRPERVLQIARETGAYEEENWRVRKDGSIFWANVVLTALWDQAGVLKGFAKVTRDMTERRKNEENIRALNSELERRVEERTAKLETANRDLDILLKREQAALAEAEKSHRRLSFLSEATKSLSVSLDYQGTLETVARLPLPELADWCYVDMVDLEGRIQRVATAHRDPEKQALVDQLKAFPPDPLAIHPAVKVIRTGLPELENDHPGVQLRSFSRNQEHVSLVEELGLKAYMSIPLKGHDRILGAITFLLSDSSRRYDAEDLALGEELANRAALAIENARLYKEAQEAVHLRDQFLSVAAHELKTPVTSLKGFSQLITRELKKDGAYDPTRVRRGMEVIDQQTTKLSALVTHLLEISRLDTGKLDLNLQKTEIVQLTQEIVTMARASSNRHTIEVQAISPIYAIVDPLRLEQVISNLLNNSIKFSPRGGPIKVEISLSDASNVIIRVIDQGVGVPPQNRDRLFERFYQAHPGDHTSGMGLGLFISQQIVQLHGGEIKAEFPDEGGTRMVVVLPTKLPREEALAISA